MSSFWLWLRIGFLSIIPTVLIFCARSGTLEVYQDLQGKVYPGIGVGLANNIILAFGLILQACAIIVPLNKEKQGLERRFSEYKIINNNIEMDHKQIIANLEKKLSKRTEQINSLLRYYFKDLTETALATMTGQQKVDIEIRIFLPEKSDRSSVTYFGIRNIHPLATVGNTNDLKFEVTPNPEGLVGQCYKKKDIVFNDNLKSNLQNTARRYNMTTQQINKTCNVGFCLCVPIEKKREVVAIVAYDSENTAINISALPKENRESLLQTFRINSQFLYEYFPELFKEEGVS